MKENLALVQNNDTPKQRKAINSIYQFFLQFSRVLRVFRVEDIEGNKLFGGFEVQMGFDSSRGVYLFFNIAENLIKHNHD